MIENPLASHIDDQPVVLILSAEIGTGQMRLDHWIDPFLVSHRHIKGSTVGKFVSFVLKCIVFSLVSEHRPTRRKMRVGSPTGAKCRRAVHLGEIFGLYCIRRCGTGWVRQRPYGKFVFLTPCKYCECKHQGNGRVYQTMPAKQIQEPTGTETRDPLD